MKTSKQKFVTMKLVKLSVQESCFLVISFGPKRKLVRISNSIQTVGDHDEAEMVDEALSVF